MTHRHLSDQMSELVENTLNDLEQSKVEIPLPIFGVVRVFGGDWGRRGGSFYYPYSSNL